MTSFKSWLEAVYVQGTAHRSPLDALKKLYHSHSNRDNLVCTFTQIDKVGLNPQSKYNTPLGIYLYPAYYVLDQEMKVPFAGDSPYLHVCELSPDANILHCFKPGSRPGSEEQDRLDLVNHLVNTFHLSLPRAIEQARDKGAKIWATEYLKTDHGYNIRSNYSALWLTAMLAADKNPVKWNKVFRQIFVDGFVDHGTGTIHPNEPTQAVVFDKNNLKLVLTIDNRKHQHRPKPDWLTLKRIRDTLKQLVHPDAFTRQFKKNVAKNVIMSTHHVISYLENSVQSVTKTSQWATVLRLTDEIRTFINRYKNILTGRRIHPTWREFYELIFKALENLLPTSESYWSENWESHFHQARFYLGDAEQIANDAVAPPAAPELWQAAFRRESGKRPEKIK